MALGDLVKTLVVKFTSENFEVVKAEIDDIPDDKTVTIKFDDSQSSAVLSALGAKMERALAQAGNDSGNSFWGNFFKRLAYQGFGGPGPIPSFFTSVPGLAVAAGVIGASLSYLDMLASGLAAAGQGVVAFGALAYPTFSAVSGAISNLSTDTAAYQAATTAAAKSTALAKIKADWAALDPVQKVAVKDVLALQNQFDALAAKFEPLLQPIISTVLGKGGIVSQIIQDLPAFANPAAKAIEGLLVQFDKFLNSPAAAAFQKAMQAIEGPAITAIGQGIGQVVGQVAQLFTIFSAKDDVRAIKVTFDVIAGAIHDVAQAIRISKDVWDWFTRSAVPALVHAFDNVKHAWDNVSHAIDNFNHALDNIGHAISNVVHAFDNIKHAFDNVTHAADNFNHAIDNVRHFVAVAATDIWHAIDSAFQFVKRLFTSDIESWGNTAINWFRSLPGKIKGALGNLGSLLVSAGRAIIDGLIAGIQSALPGLLGVLSGIGGLIASHKGPIEVDRLLLFPHGQAIMQGLMAGIGSQVPALQNQLAGITRGIYGGGLGQRYGGAGGGNVTINFNGIVGDPHRTAMEIQQMLLQLKRRRFGTQGNTATGLGLA